MSTEKKMTRGVLLRSIVIFNVNTGSGVIAGTNSAFCSRTEGNHRRHSLMELDGLQDPHIQADFLKWLKNFNFQVSGLF
jgi:hypothetical protein